MTVFALKLIAVLTMLVDHLGILLWQKLPISTALYTWMRSIGRFAFPVYCFLLAEGFRHLRQKPGRLREHLLLLLVLAVLSEPLFDYMGHRSFDDPGSQSVMLTLLLGFGGLWLAELLRDRPLPRLAVMLCCCALGRMIAANYGAAGVLLIFLFYWYLEELAERPLPRRLLGMACVMLVYYLFYCWSSSDFGGMAAFLERLRSMGVYCVPHLLLIPMLAAYNGRLGPRSGVLHRCYQYFYPAHLALLCLAFRLL